MSKYAVAIVVCGQGHQLLSDTIYMTPEAVHKEFQSLASRDKLPTLDVITSFMSDDSRSSDLFLYELHDDDVYLKRFVVSN